MKFKPALFFVLAFFLPVQTVQANNNFSCTWNGFADPGYQCQVHQPTCDPGFEPVPSFCSELNVSNCEGAISNCVEVNPVDPVVSECGVLQLEGCLIDGGFYGADSCGDSTIGSECCRDASFCTPIVEPEPDPVEPSGCGDYMALQQICSVNGTRVASFNVCSGDPDRNGQCCTSDVQCPAEPDPTPEPSTSSCGTYVDGRCFQDPIGFTGEISVFLSCSGGGSDVVCCSDLSMCPAEPEPETDTTSGGGGGEGVQIEVGGLNLTALNPSPNFTPQGLLGQFVGGSGSNPGILALAIVFGGFALLFMIVQAGLQIVSNPGDPKAFAAAQARITYAIIGFFLLFAAFWIVQILETIFGVSVTG